MAAWCFSCREKVRESRREYLFTQIPSDDKRPLCQDASYGCNKITMILADPVLPTWEVIHFVLCVKAPAM
ncbi:Carboxypeptidase D, partial [Operophtera brumata]